MTTIYNTEILDNAIKDRIKYLINQIYKLLPIREEEKNWQDRVRSLVEELNGMLALLPNCHSNLFPIICKLQGLLALESEEDFSLYRKTIFEILNLMGGMIQCL